MSTLQMTVSLAQFSPPSPGFQVPFLRFFGLPRHVLKSLTCVHNSNRYFLFFGPCLFAFSFSFRRGLVGRPFFCGVDLRTIPSLLALLHLEASTARVMPTITLSVSTANILSLEARMVFFSSRTFLPLLGNVFLSRILSESWAS